MVQEIEEFTGQIPDAELLTAAEYAHTRGTYAKEKGDYAKEQGDYAKEQGDSIVSTLATKVDNSRLDNFKQKTVLSTSKYISTSSLVVAAVGDYIDFTSVSSSNIPISNPITLKQGQKITFDKTSEPSYVHAIGEIVNGKFLVLAKKYGDSELSYTSNSPTKDVCYACISSAQHTYSITGKSVEDVVGEKANFVETNQLLSSKVDKVEGKSLIDANVAASLSKGGNNEIASVLSITTSGDIKAASGTIKGYKVEDLSGNKLEDKADKTYVDTKLATKQDKLNYYSESELQAKISVSEDSTVEWRTKPSISLGGGGVDIRCNVVGHSEYNTQVNIGPYSNTAILPGGLYISAPESAAFKIRDKKIVTEDMLAGKVDKETGKGLIDSDVATALTYNSTNEEVVVNDRLSCCSSVLADNDVCAHYGMDDEVSLVSLSAECVKAEDTEIAVSDLDVNYLTRLSTAESNISDLSAEVGDLEDLTTTAKSNLVAAINEVKAGGGGSSAGFSLVNTITTTEDSGKTIELLSAVGTYSEAYIEMILPSTVSTALKLDNGTEQMWLSLINGAYRVFWHIRFDNTITLTDAYKYTFAGDRMRLVYMEAGTFFSLDRSKKIQANFYNLSAAPVGLTFNVYAR